MTSVASRQIRPIAGHGRLLAAFLLCLTAAAATAQAQDAAAPPAAPAQLAPTLPAVTASQPMTAPPPAPMAAQPTAATQQPAPALSDAPLAAPAATPPGNPVQPATAPAQQAVRPEAPPATPALDAGAPSPQPAPLGTVVSAPQQDVAMPSPALEAPLAVQTEPPHPHDLSPWGMFLNADPVVKGVMILLSAASVATWTILLFKFVELAFARLRLARAMRIMRRATSLVELSGQLRNGVASRIVGAAIAESERSVGLPADGIKERVMLGLMRLELAVGRRMMIGTGLLATIGSTGPFVGLFGTVWGIMRSFIGIANSNTTNLAVVAPGIAEALLATGIGLVAAIPAVVIYNILVRSVSGYRAMVSDASTEVICHLSRDLDRRRYASTALNPSIQQQAAE